MRICDDFSKLWWYECTLLLSICATIHVKPGAGDPPQDPDWTQKKILSTSNTARSELGICWGTLEVKNDPLLVEGYRVYS